MDEAQKSALRGSSYVPSSDYQDMPRSDAKKDLKPFAGKTWYPAHFEHRTKPVFQAPPYHARDVWQSGKKTALLLKFYRVIPHTWESFRMVAETSTDSFIVSKLKAGKNRGQWLAVRQDKNGEVVWMHDRPILATGTSPAIALARACGIRQIYRRKSAEWVSLHDYYSSVHFDFDSAMRKKRRMLYPKRWTTDLPFIAVPDPHIPQAQATIPPTGRLVKSVHATFTPDYANWHVPPTKEPARFRPMSWRKQYEYDLPPHYRANRVDWWLEKLVK